MIWRLPNDSRSARHLSLWLWRRERGASRFWNGPGVVSYAITEVNLQRNRFTETMHLRPVTASTVCFAIIASAFYASLRSFPPLAFRELYRSWHRGSRTPLGMARS